MPSALDDSPLDSWRVRLKHFGHTAAIKEYALDSTNLPMYDEKRLPLAEGVLGFPDGHMHRKMNEVLQVNFLLVFLFVGLRV